MNFIKMIRAIQLTIPWTFALLCLVLGTMPNTADASSLGSDLTLSLSVRASSPQGTFANIQRSAPGRPLIFELRFDSSLSANAPPPSLKIDLYFGGILPNGQLFSWVDDNIQPGRLKLQAGYIPILRDLGFEGSSPMPIVTEWSRHTEHNFGRGDALGNYFLFAIAVRSGMDPSDTDNWVLHDNLFVLLQP